MKRATVRALKRTVRKSPPLGSQQAQHAALALLSRSVMFGHGRLAVQRLKLAVDAGAQVPNELWVYCSRAAVASEDAKMQGLYRDTALQATHGRADPV